MKYKRMTYSCFYILICGYEIQVMIVEYNVSPEGKDAILNLMVNNGYTMMYDFGEDFIFQKNKS
jgi:hypothetical protein